ncbi:hypothetical protein BD310DRAFT_659807 [Dichomitus squalens]|uniref:Uncharacterized protein n=1 Tax=Dichomitus squalens TaxID=114155 RepID=A0A4Q9Q665_9APHY|nr:hypothetical protein BD310DRAFT_659807 [Dichomitus squalens]
MAGGGTTAAASNRRKNLAGPSSWAGLLANARVFALAIFASLGGLAQPVCHPRSPGKRSTDVEFSLVMPECCRVYSRR